MPFVTLNESSLLLSGLTGFFHCQFLLLISDFSISNAFLWLNYGSYIEIVNVHTDESWKYTFDDGIPGSIIYKVGSDNDWVWFTTNDGVGFFNWSNYHYE